MKYSTNIAPLHRYSLLMASGLLALASACGDSLNAPDSGASSAISDAASNLPDGIPQEFPDAVQEELPLDEWTDDFVDEEWPEPDMEIVGDPFDTVPEIEGNPEVAALEDVDANALEAAYVTQEAFRALTPVAMVAQTYMDTLEGGLGALGSTSKQLDQLSERLSSQSCMSTGAAGFLGIGIKVTFTDCSFLGARISGELKVRPTANPLKGKVNLIMEFTDFSVNDNLVRGSSTSTLSIGVSGGFIDTVTDITMGLPLIGETSVHFDTRTGYNFLKSSLQMSGSGGITTGRFGLALSLEDVAIQIPTFIPYSGNLGIKMELFGQSLEVAFGTSKFMLAINDKEIGSFNVFDIFNIIKALIFGRQ